MTYTLEIREEAEEEIYEAFSWYEQQLSELGDRFIRELDLVFKKITSTPQYYKTARSVFRQASVQSFPFVVYYEIDNSKIIVYSVFHTKRKPKKDF